MSQTGPMVYKKITGGLSCGYEWTDAVGDLATVKRTGIMQCGSGDDHVLSQDEMNLVKKHDTAADLNLPEGKLGRIRRRRKSADKPGKQRKKK